MQRFNEPYLFLKGRTFYFRCRIPKRFVEYVGAPELKRSLFTSDLILARQRCHRLHRKFVQLIANIENMPEPNKTEIIEIARVYLEQKLVANELGTIEPIEDEYYGGEYQADHWNQEAQRLRERCASSDFDRHTLAATCGIRSALVDPRPHQLGV